MPFIPLVLHAATASCTCHRCGIPFKPHSDFGAGACGAASSTCGPTVSGFGCYSHSNEESVGCFCKQPVGRSVPMNETSNSVSVPIRGTGITLEVATYPIWNDVVSMSIHSNKELF